MMADLVFYNENYGGEGKIPASLFPLWARRAEAELDYITNRKIIEKDDDTIRMCVCEMAEFLYNECQKDGISSENNDGFSVTYQNRDIKQELMKIAKTYLGATNLLYRGVDCEK